MSNRKPPMMDAADFLAQKAGDNLPPHDFRIGENNQASIDQLPNFLEMAPCVIGKAPSSYGELAVIGEGPHALGALIGDAALKLLRPWPQYCNEAFMIEQAPRLVLDIADSLRMLSPIADGVLTSFLCRMGEFMDIVLEHPGWLPAIIANIDTLTNARLTERAREILITGIDPGAADLWDEKEWWDWASAPAEGARYE